MTEIAEAINHLANVILVVGVWVCAIWLFK